MEYKFEASEKSKNLKEIKKLRGRSILLLVIIIGFVLMIIDLAYAISSTVAMNIQVVKGYWSYTKGFNCTCDVLVECNGTNLLNTTLMTFRWDEIDYSSWCDD